jgi:hypothetical protein
MCRRVPQWEAIRKYRGIIPSFSVTLADGGGTIYRTAYLHFQLNNCGGNIPVVTGTEVIIQNSFDLRAAIPGGNVRLG